MSDTFEGIIGLELASAIAKKGYTTLTPVQHAVLDPALVGRDLRISSQTGSGKTIAIGFTVPSLSAWIVGYVAGSMPRMSFKKLVWRPTNACRSTCPTQRCRCTCGCDFWSSNDC